MRKSNTEYIDEVSISISIYSFDYDSNHHVNHSNNYCEFHLQTIIETHWISCYFPHWIDSKVISAWLSSRDMLVLNWETTFPPSKIQPEEFIIDDSTIKHPKHSYPPPFVRFQHKHGNDSKYRVPNIAKHNSNEESKCDNIQRSRVHFIDIGNSIGVDDGLRDFHHFSCGEESRQLGVVQMFRNNKSLIVVGFW